MADEYEEAQRTKEQALVRILAQGMQSIPEADLKAAVAHAMVSVVQSLNLQTVMAALLEPIVREHFAAMKDTADFKQAVEARVKAEVMSAIGRLRCTENRY